MKNKVAICVFAALVGVAIILTAVMIDRQTSHTKAAIERGWTPIGETPQGTTIYKKYFPNEGIWIYSSYSAYETISAVREELKAEKK